VSDATFSGVTHVLYLSEVPGRNSFSGAENQVFVLLEGLARSGVDVELIAMLWAGDDYPSVSARLRELEAAGVRVVRVRRAAARSSIARWWAMMQSWAALWRLLRARRDRAIHLHLDLGISVVVAALAGCRKVLASVHNDEPAYATLRWRVWWRIANLFVRRYISITHHVERYVRRVGGLAAGRVSTIYYGIAPSGPAPDARERLGLDRDSFVVGFVGRLTPQKNLFAFVDAMAALPDVVAVIVGNGELRPALEQAIAGRQLNNVRLVGGIPDAGALMPAFDLFCLPSLWEGLGVVLIEAMLHHVPIAGSNRGAIPEILDNGRLGVLFEPTASGIAAAIAAVRVRPEAARARAEEAYDHATRLFTVPRMVTETVAVYRAL
jgi:glycosyltransferase involved in cell wall biosynthesis